MSSDEYADAVSNQPDDGERSYVSAGLAPTSDANAAVDALNTYAACREAGKYDQVRSLYTHYGLYWSHTNAHNIDEWNGYQQARIDAGFALSPAFDPASAITVSLADEASPFTTQFSAENVILLEDGRVAVLHTVVLPADSQLVEHPHIVELGSATILKNDNGAWLIEESVPLCFSNCEVNRVTLESVLLIVPVTIPEATPASD